MDRRRVLVTGAAGGIASQLLPTLRKRYECTLTDVRSVDSDGCEVEGLKLLSLLPDHLDEARALFDGQDAVVHLAFESSMTDEFEGEMANIRMAYNVLRLASDAGVRRVVIASSNHAADFYEPPLLRGEIDMLTPTEGLRPLSDNFYGWAKEAYEHLGFVFAAGKVGAVVENVHIRIGAPRPVGMQGGNNPGESYSFRRNLGAYISPRDLAQLVVKSIETEDVTNTWGVPWHVVYGISDNTRAFWSIANARQVLGYAPEDDSEAIWAEDVRDHVTAKGVTGRIGEHP